MNKNIGLVLFTTAITCCTFAFPIMADEISSDPVENQVVDEGVSQENGNDNNENSVQNGWHVDGTYWLDGTQYKNGVYNIDSNTYYFDGNGNVLKNNWKELNGNTYFFDNNGYMIKNCIYTINCHMYSFDEDGSLQKNYIHYDSYNKPDIYFGEDGKAIESQWVEINEKQYYCKSDGYIARNVYHICIGEDYYCFDSDGQVLKDYVYCVVNYTYVFGSDGKAVRNNWVSLYGNTSYCDDTGLVIKNQIKEIENDVYGFDSDGKVIKNCEYKNYYFGEDGKALKNKWIETSDGFKYFGDNGYMYQEPKIYDIDGLGYAFNSNGIMLTGWQQPYLNSFYQSDAWYYFDSDGHLLKNQWIDDCYVNEDGKRITSQNYKIDGNLYHFDNHGNVKKDYVYQSGDSVYYFGVDGKAIKNQWRITSEGKQYYGDDYLLYNKPGMFNIDGKFYTFNENGIMLIGWQQPYIRNKYACSDIWYLFDSTGARVTKGQWKDGYYADDCGSRVLNKLYKIDEDYYLFDEDGKPKTNYLYYGGLEGVRYFGIDGKQYTNKWLDTPEGKMYFGSDGKSYCGTNLIGNDTYYFDSNGLMQIGWQNNCYFNDDGTMAKNQWVGEYYIDENGNKLKSGLKIIDNVLYYFDSDGLLKKDFAYQRYYFGLDGKAIKNQWRKTENGWMYYDENSMYCISNLIDIGDYTYSFSDDGVRVTGWKSFETSNMNLDWYYFDLDGRLLKNQWIDGYYVDDFGIRVENTFYHLADGTYLFDKNGNVLTGWQSVNDEYYYFDQSGKMITNAWQGNYYLRDNGQMAKDSWIGNYYVDSNGLWTPDRWILTSGKWWYRHQDGSYTKSDFESIGGKTYYFDGFGYMVTGWKKISNIWYYFENSGALAKNRWINNYYVDENGIMETNKWIGNYYVDSSGLWTPNKWVKTNGKWWYRHQDGSYTKNNFELIGGQWYFFDANGYMVTGWKKVGNIWYYFDGSGIMSKNKWVGNYYFESSGAMATNKWIGNYYVGTDGKWIPNYS